MWRFAIITKEQSILNKISLKAICETWKPTFTNSTFSRFASNDAAVRVTEQERPIQEVFSLEDFGLLSVSRSSLTSVSSFEHEQTFIDHLLRNETLSVLPQPVQIPTTVDSKELGGSNEASLFDQTVELLSDGNDARIVAEELEQEVEYLSEQEPSTSKSNDVVQLPFLLSNFEQLIADSAVKPIKTRQFLSENVRRERKLNLSTTNIQEKETSLASKNIDFMRNVGEMMFPEDIPTESFTSEWKSEELINYSEAIHKVEAKDSKISSEICLEVLEDLVAENKLDDLHLELNNGNWPDYLFSAGDRKSSMKLNRILRYYVMNWKSAEDVEKVLQNITSHVFAVISDDIILRLAEKFAVNNNSKSLIKKLDDILSFCCSREVRPNKKLVNETLQSLYLTSLKYDYENAQAVLNKCIKTNFDSSAEQFLKSFSEFVIKSNEISIKNFKTYFEVWKKLSTKYGTTVGVDNFWLLALSEKENKLLGKNIELLLRHCNNFDHPFTTMAHMICAFIRLNEIDKAIDVFKTVSVSGRHFKTPLKTLVESNDLKSIEQLGNVIEKGIIGERRKKNIETQREEQNEKIRLEENVHGILAKFYGLNERKQKSFKKKNMKRKIHKVDEEQLHNFCESLQEAWIRCAEKQNDKLSAKRLLEWCQRNRIEIDNKWLKKIENFE